MSCNALCPATLPLLLALLAGAAQAQTPAAVELSCVTAVARDFNGLVPLLAEAQREGRDDLAGLVGRLNALRARITGAMEATSPAGEPCDALARDLAVERGALQRVLPTPVPAAAPPLPPAAPPAQALPASPRQTAKAPARAAERRVAVPPPTPVKRAAYTPPPPAPRADPQLEACKTQLRQTHADAQLQLQMAARSGRIVPQKLPDMQRAQSRLAGLAGEVRRDFETVGECQQVAHALVQEVGSVQALAH
jgi:hypothetical protein